MNVTGGYGSATTPAVGPAAGGETFSPFGETLSAATGPASASESVPTALESPFGSGIPRELDLSEAEQLGEIAGRTLGELEDEDFTDALEAVRDEASARHITDTGAWSVAPSSGQAHALLEEWVEPLA